MNRSRKPKPLSGPTIILTGGGTAGHITPLLSLARAIKDKQSSAKIVFIGLKDEKISGLQTQYSVFDETYFISAGKFRRYYQGGFLRQLLDVRSLALNVRDFFRVIAGTISAWKIIRRIRPSAVFSKGGFVVVPVALAARLFKVPILTHDSDATAGMANRIAGRWATIHATGMPPSYYSYPPKTVVQVGIPLRDELTAVSPAQKADFKRQLHLPPKSLVLLVAGGSLGARKINQLAVAIAPELLSKNPALHIIHISGEANELEVNKSYFEFLSDENQKRVRVIGFSNELYKYSGAADLIITRAGATALAEFAAQKKACIVIPSPFLADGHQLKNALELSRQKAVVVVDQDDLPANLLAKVQQLLDNPKARRSLAEKLGSTALPGASSKLADLLLQLSGK